MSSISLSPNQKLWSELNPSLCQFLLCDLQQHIFPSSRTTPPKKVVQTTSSLCELSQQFAIPLTFSVTPTPNGDPNLPPALQPYGESDKLLIRSGVDPFLHSATKDSLAGERRPMLVIAGVATEGVVLHAAMSGLANGYKVIVAIDGCSGFSERTEAAAVRLMEAGGAVMLPALSIATAFGPDFSKPEGQKVLGVIRRLIA